MVEGVQNIEKPIILEKETLYWKNTHLHKNERQTLSFFMIRRKVVGCFGLDFVNIPVRGEPI